MPFPLTAAQLVTAASNFDQLVVDAMSVAGDRPKGFGGKIFDDLEQGLSDLHAESGRALDNAARGASAAEVYDLATCALADIEVSKAVNEIARILTTTVSTPDMVVAIETKKTNKTAPKPWLEETGRTLIDLRDSYLELSRSTTRSLIDFAEQAVGVGARRSDQPQVYDHAFESVDETTQDIVGGRARADYVGRLKECGIVLDKLGLESVARVAEHRAEKIEERIRGRKLLVDTSEEDLEAARTLTNAVDTWAASVYEGTCDYIRDRLTEADFDEDARVWVESCLKETS